MILMKEKTISRKERKERVENDGTPRTTVSFYRYVKIQNPQTVRDELFEKLSDFGCLGRIYIAKEGINAQMNVPNAKWNEFDAYIQSRPEFSGIPYKIAVEETDHVSFYKLTIKVRPKIVADGLDDDTFDVTNTGEYLTAKEMNEYINDPDAVVVILVG